MRSMQNGVTALYTSAFKIQNVIVVTCNTFLKWIQMIGSNSYRTKKYVAEPWELRCKLSQMIEYWIFISKLFTALCRLENESVKIV